MSCPCEEVHKESDCEDCQDLPIGTFKYLRDLNTKAANNIVEFYLISSLIFPTKGNYDLYYWVFEED